MRLDVKYQPLNFDIYLSQVIDVPKTSLDEAPYDFTQEQKALRIVDSMLGRATAELEDAANGGRHNPKDLLDEDPMLMPTTINQGSDQQCNSQSTSNSSSTLTSKQPLQPQALQDQIRPVSTLSTTSTITNSIGTNAFPSSSIFLPPPSCPIETPLTPIKCLIEPTSENSMASSVGNKSNQETGSREQTVNQINPLEFEEMHYNPFDHLELQTIDERRELDLVFQASYADQASKQ